MAKRQNMAVERADAFVAAVNASARMALPCEGVPERCRLPATASEGSCGWRVVSAPDAGWLSELEDQLPYRWPLTFRALIGRYLFPSFVCGPLRLYSVGVKDFAAEDTELRIAVMRDRLCSRLCGSTDTSRLPALPMAVRHPPQSGWLDELGRLKGG